MSSLSDEQLIRSCAEGRQHHCKVLYDRYQRLVGKVLYDYFRDPHLVDDLRQETFIKAFRGLDRFRGEAAFKNWLLRIAVNVCRDHQRRRQRQPAEIESLDAMLNGKDGPQNKPEPADNPERSDPSVQYEKMERKALIAKALEKLDPEDRQIVLLWSEGFKQQEIAVIVNLPKGTVGRKISEAKALIKSIIEMHYQQGWEHL